MIDAIAWKYRTGCPWQDLPGRYGSWKGADTRLRNWAVDGTWEKVSVPHTEELPAPPAPPTNASPAPGREKPTRTIRFVTLRHNLRRDDRDTAGEDHMRRVYRHRWFIRPHPTNQLSTGEIKKIWRGPYPVVPPGCGHAPILGGGRFNVLRR